MSQKLSYIQNQIITRLKYAQSINYTALKPQGVANDLFNYHLQFLVQKGYVNKDESGYFLGEKGIKWVADPYADEQGGISRYSFFKVNVITILSRINENGKIEILNQHRLSNPSYGKIGVPGGVVLKGEKILDAASRKLETETGLRAKFKLIGTERRFLYKENDLFSDVIFPITYSNKSTGTLISENQYGQNVWVSIDQAIKNESAEFDSIKSIVKVLKAIKSGKINDLPLFFDEESQVDYSTSDL